MDNLERRAWAECRAEASDNGRKIRGYGVVFNALSVDLGGFREIIAPEAIDRTLNEGLDVRALVDHDSSKVIGRTRSGTLRLRKDSRGLHIEVEPDEEISYARDIMRAVARGDVSGMSFGFRVVDDSWNYDDKVPVRTVTDMRVSEVSIVPGLSADRRASGAAVAPAVPGHTGQPAGLPPQDEPERRRTMKGAD
jgi:HK97 family phage prohead protease